MAGRTQLEFGLKLDTASPNVRSWSLKCEEDILSSWKVCVKVLYSSVVWNTWFEQHGCLKGGQWKGGIRKGKVISENSQMKVEFGYIYIELLIRTIQKKNKEMIDGSRTQNKAANQH